MQNNKTKKAQQQLYHFGANEYAFYLKDWLGKEWVVLVREYSPEKGIYELRTAFRADCGPKFQLEEGGVVIDEFDTYYELMIAQEFVPVSLL